jgi:hypothetical protein
MRKSKSSTCKHPNPYAWMARDDTVPGGSVLCVACNVCGAVLKSASQWDEMWNKYKLERLQALVYKYTRMAVAAGNAHMGIYRDAPRTKHLWYLAHKAQRIYNNYRNFTK